MNFLLEVKTDELWNGKMLVGTKKTTNIFLCLNQFERGIQDAKKNTCD